MKYFPEGSLINNLHTIIGDTGSVPGLGRSLEMGMAAHSSILAWRIPWTQEPVGYCSWGHRVRYD